ncbi:hypothetical protein B0H14DRAFT_3538434 [Mycena olivaceomarginata]|nr:hypothetical protein B0H14DRAFT_3538434 [Mycena olivaceomarginata]
MPQMPQRLGEQLEGARDEVAGLREELAASSRELSQRRAQSQAELKRVRAASVAEIRDLRDNYDKSRAELDWAQGRREADAALFEVRQTAQAELLGVRQTLAAAEAQLQSALQDVELVRDKWTQERIADAPKTAENVDQLEKQLAQAVNEGCEVLERLRLETDDTAARNSQMSQMLESAKRELESQKVERDAAVAARSQLNEELLQLQSRLDALELVPLPTAVPNDEPPLETHIHAPADLEMAPEPAPDPPLCRLRSSPPQCRVQQWPDVTVNPPEPPSARPTKIARRSRVHASATVYVPNIDDILAPPAPLGSANWLEFYVNHKLQLFAKDQGLKEMGKRVHHLVPTLQAIAAHHNAAKARWKTPGKWMGDDLAEFDPDQAPAVVGVPAAAE